MMLTIPSGNDQKIIFILAYTSRDPINDSLELCGLTNIYVILDAPYNQGWKRNQQTALISYSSNKKFGPVLLCWYRYYAVCLFTCVERWTLKAAEKGDTTAQFNVGAFFEEGKGVQQDYVKAFEWYLKAAEKGDTDAQFVIGCIYRKGAGVEQDDVKAFEWYLRAAEKGYARAQLNIGVCFDDGIGVEQDDVKAFEWYFKAAEKGCKDGQFNLGCCYKKGEGVEMDLKLALYWLSKVVNDFEFIEPYDEFGIEPFKTCDVNNLTTNENEIPLIEQVIIRFEEKDFTISNNFSSSKYLSTMMNSHWRNFNQKYENQTILDLRSIENDIFQEETNHIQ
ncbi:predicted protein [Naegleria gruberi]|uniref:Predicted protein n=1 Tax=Naegleria gruberi TaxID=5762 RepID=D2UX11_NAEGR|nr:uncharacterized protein NAEGRDRAFT_61597 [Naegleria gruberi]EFC50852.1 predicted protein [Naegleria gruberi]|eukprot:XP_002683596.1 predicted protein [Naegleria gruberi strain NEG-M]